MKACESSHLWDWRWAARLGVVGFVLAIGIEAAGAQRAQQPEMRVLDENAAWWMQTTGGQWKKCAVKDGWLVADVRLDAKRPGAVVRLDLADVPGLDGRAPVGVEEFAVTIDVPTALAESGKAVAGGGLFWIDPEWRWRELPGGKSHAFDDAGRRTSRLRPGVVRDAVALGVFIGLSDDVPAGFRFSGEIRIRIDKLMVRLGGERPSFLPSAGEVERTLEQTDGWRIGPGFGGGVEMVRTEGGAVLRCDLDATNPKKLSAVARLDIPRLDMRERGLFVTVEVPAGLVTRGKFRAGVGAGLYCGQEVFWGRGEPFTEPGRVTVALYPETRFPLPFSFRSDGFDPSRVTGVAVRVGVNQGTKQRFAGEVRIVKAQIVRAPKEFMARRERIAKSVESEFARQPAAGEATGRVPIEKFIRSIGVNFPWPVNHKGAPVYPPLGARCWDDQGRQGGLEVIREVIRKDFQMFVANRIALVRVWLFCDLRSGFTRDGRGNLVMAPGVLSDLAVLLDEAQEAGVDLIPVLFDFLLNDGFDRERLALVGEFPEIITDAAVRKQFLDCIEPALKMLCAGKAVRMIDLWNEPGQMIGPMDAVLETIRDLAERVHSLPGNKPVTVGVRNSIELAFWMRAGLDVGTFHWFSKTEPNRYPKGWAPTDVNRPAAIVTEIEATGGVAETLQTLWEAGLGGGLIWSVHGQDGISPFGEKQAQAFGGWVETHTDGRK